MRKQALNPDVPMKPLYWTRILVPVTTANENLATASESLAQVNSKHRLYMYNNMIYCYNYSLL